MNQATLSYTEETLQCSGFDKAPVSEGWDGNWGERKLTQTLDATLQPYKATRSFFLSSSFSTTN